MKTLQNLSNGLLILTVFISAGCVKKMFPDNTLYQYSKKPNDMAVVYPDGSIHHADGSISAPKVKVDEAKNDEQATNDSEESVDTKTPDLKEQPVRITSRIDSTGRHAKVSR